VVGVDASIAFAHDGKEAPVRTCVVLGVDARRAFQLADQSLSEPGTPGRSTPQHVRNDSSFRSSRCISKGSCKDGSHSNSQQDARPQHAVTRV